MANRAALNLATLGAVTLDRKLYAAAAAGFAAVGMRQEDFEDPEARARQELRLNDLTVAEIEGIGDWMAPGRTARTIALVRAEVVFETAAEVGAELVIASPSVEPVELLAAAAQFRDLCRAAEPFGVRVGLEFLGDSPTVRDLAQAWAIVEMAEMSNGGLVVDTFHFVRGGSTLEMMEPIPGERIFLVQVSDAPDLPLAELDDRNRLYPGTGALALEPLLSALREKGYGGYWSLELRNDEYWGEDPVLVAAEGMRAMRRLDLT